MIKRITGCLDNTPLITYPDKCPHCDKDFVFAPLSEHTIRTDKYLLVCVKCEHCENPVFVFFDHKSDKTISIFPPETQITLQSEIRELSPIACTVLEQTLHAKSLGLSYLIGAGLRKTLEHLVWDYLTKLKGFSEEDLRKKTLSQRIKCIEGNNYAVVCSNIIRVFGNANVHLFDDSDIDIEEAVKVLRVLIDNIYAEIFIQKVNAKL